MELCETTLKKIMDEDGWGEENEEGWKRHVTLGICNLHQIGIIHRDINPSNILFKKEQEAFPTVKVADFNVFTIHEAQDHEMNQPGCWTVFIQSKGGEGRHHDP